VERFGDLADHDALRFGTERLTTTKGGAMADVAMERTTETDAKLDVKSTPAAEPVVDEGDGVTEELLVEEVSIDGMCGVY